MKHTTVKKFKSLQQAREALPTYQKSGYVVYAGFRKGSFCVRRYKLGYKDLPKESAGVIQSAFSSDELCAS